MKNVILSALVLYSSAVLSMSEQVTNEQSSPSVISQVISFFSWLGNKSKELENLVKQDKAYKANINNKLLRACRVGDLAVVKEALAQGANLETTNANNWTPFYTALFYRHKEIVRYLLSFNKYLSDSYEDKNATYTLTDFLCDKGVDRSTPIAKSLLAKFTNDRFSCYKINGEFVVEVPNDNGDGLKTIIAPTSPLHFAALKGQSGIVELLLRAGASTETMHVNGDTVLDHLLSVVTDTFDSVPVLLKYGAVTRYKANLKGALGLEKTQKIYDYLKQFRDPVIKELAVTQLLPEINHVISEYIYGDKSLDEDIVWQKKKHNNSDDEKE